MKPILGVVSVLVLTVVISATVFVALQPTDSAPKAADLNQVNGNGLVGDDAFVDKDTPTKNFGSSPVLWADGESEKISYIKLNLASLAGKDIKSANLHLFVNNPALQPSQIWDVPTSSWTGDTITYNVRPLLGSQIGTINGGTAGSWLDVDLTQFVKDNVGKVVSIAITTNDPGGLSFNSSKAPFNKLELQIVE